MDSCVGEALGVMLSFIVFDICVYKSYLITLSDHSAL